MPASPVATYPAQCGLTTAGTVGPTAAEPTPMGVARRAAASATGSTPSSSARSARAAIRHSSDLSDGLWRRRVAKDACDRGGAVCHFELLEHVLEVRANRV